VGWPAPRAAVEQALAIEGGPVVLADFGDTTTGGAPGDSTAILKELLAHELPGRALVTVVDAQTVEAAIAVGVGNELTAELGGKIDRKHHTPVRVTGRVRAISDGRYVMADGPVPGPADMKRTVVLEVGSLSIVVSEQAGPVLHPALYRSVGLEPADASIVVVKSAYSFRAAYAPFARAMIMVNSPGVTSADLRSNAHLFRLAPRPLYPLDDDATF